MRFFFTVADGTQYGREDLNVTQAWKLATGYALIGDIDTGLATDHVALKQFSNAGQYLGGNLKMVSNSANYFSQ
jgi:hypothetical protein